MKKFTVLLLLTFFALTTYAADSDLDATFDGDGKVTTNNFFEEGGRDVVIQPDGKIVVVGGKTSTFNVQNFAAVRYNTNGSLDSTFGAGGIYVLPTLIGNQAAAGKAAAVDLQPDGKILLAGTGGTFNSSNQIFLIIRLNTNGTLDTTFGSDGRVIKDIGKPNSYGGLSAMVFDAARSKIYLGGTTDISSDGGTYAYTVMRFNADGAIDTTFNGTGTQAFPVAESRPLATGINDIAVQADGKIIAVGKTQYSIPNTPSIESFGTARINVDGTLDSSFGTNGIIITDFTYTDSGTTFYQNAAASTVSITPSGKIFVGGLGGSGSGGVIRNFYFAAQFNPNGSYDSSFGTNGKIRAEAIMISDSVITQSGKIIVIGEKNANFGVARLNPNGTIDTTFGTGGFVQTGFSTGGTEYPIAAALQTDGKIVAAGGSKNPNTSGPGMDYQLVSRYTGTPTVVSNAPRGTWDGGGADDNWSTAANWGADTVPTSADNVIFDATSVKNAVVDTAFTVNSVSINNGYTATITQSSVLTVANAFTQSAGTFQGTTANANFGTLILNAGSNFVAPSGTLSVTSQTAYEVFNFNGGTFNANGGTFSVDARSDLNYFRYQTPTFNNLIVNQPLTILNAAIIVNGTLTLNQILSNSQAEINGDVTFASGYTSGSAILKFGGTATRTATLNGATIGNPVEINNPNLTLTTGAVSGNVVWNQKVTLQAGKLQQTAANYLFNVFAGFNNPGFIVSGGTFQGGAGNAVFNTSIGISSGNLNGGTGDLGTNAAFCPAFPQSNYFFQQSGGSFNGGAGNARFCDLRRTGGAFTAPSGNLTILNYGDFTGGTFSANNGTLIVENNVTIVAPGFALNNVTLLGANAHSFAGTPKPSINGTFNLAEGQFSSGEVAANGDVVYGANFTGGGGRLFFEGTATRTINLPARNILLGMTLDNPNVTVTTSGAGASSFTGEVDVKRGLFQQGNAVLNVAPNIFRVSGGTFQGSSVALNISSIIVSGGTFSGGAGLISGGFGTGINQSGGTFSTVGDLEVTSFTLSGGTFNAPSGLMTVVADWTHTARGTFNPGTTGTVKFTGYNTFNCANSYGLDVNVTETFYNLEIANAFCNRRFIGTGDTLIVNGDLRLTAAAIQGGRIRPLGTTTIEASNAGYIGSTIIEYVTPNRNFVINNPPETTRTLPIEMNAPNSTLTSSGVGRLNVYALDLINGTVNQGAGIWDFTNAGLIQNFGFYRQSGGTFNGNAGELFVNAELSGGALNSGTGKVTGNPRITGGTMTLNGDMDSSSLTLEGGIFNAPLGTLKLGVGGNCIFSHTSGGTFNARTGTVIANPCGFDVNARETFNNLTFSGGGSNIGTNDTLVVNGTTVFNGSFSNGGSIEANGDVQHLNTGSGNTNGNPNTGTTVLKFVDTATRTVNFNTSNAGYAVINTLVDNPNITINLGTTENAGAGFYNGLTLRAGTINQGAGQAQISIYNQSGGTFNGGTYSAATNLNPIGNFTLSGGTFNAAPTTTFNGNFTHTAGGTFNAGNGTVYFVSTFNGANGIVDVNQTETFNNVNFRSGNGTNIAAGDTLIVNGTTTLQAGTINGGTLEVKGSVGTLPVNSGGNFRGGDASVIFSGATDQIFSNSAGFPTFGGTWTINKPNTAGFAENEAAAKNNPDFAPPSNVFLNGNVGYGVVSGNFPLSYPNLNIISGVAVEGVDANLFIGSLNVAAGASLINISNGDLTLNGDVVNNGTINLNGEGSACPQPDSILIRSSAAGTQRSWSGAGRFSIFDADVRDQAGSALITVSSGTNAGNNGANWMFNSACLVPTAATVSVGGRVINSAGNGVAKAAVVIFGGDGKQRRTTTGLTGEFSFANVRANDTIIITVQHKRYTFQPQTVSASEDITDLIFTAAP